MRILSVRGEHLTSLEAPFEVYLDRNPLAQAGIFAITGPTGAGKSTLLDTICLALFNCSPRTVSAGSVLAGKEGEEQLSANDPRIHLRRGAKSAWAEVRFSGRDGRVYRSRWEVSRAFNRQDGTLKPVSLKLTDEATASDFPGSLTEILAQIEEKLGLSFEQFRRAVLLAQGDFAAFLRANAHERAELLEKLTGQAIYSLISRRAFERAKEAAEAAKAIEAEVEVLDQQLLSFEARLDLQANKAQLEAEREALEHGVASAREALGWYQQESSRFQLLNEAISQEAAARMRQSSTLQLKNQLAQAEAAEACRTAFERMETARQESQRALNQQEQQARFLTEAEAALALSRETQKQAQSQLTQVEAEIEASKERVEATRSLDDQVRDAQKKLAALDAAFQQIEAERKRAQSDLVELEQFLSTKKMDLQDLERKLLEQPELEILATDASVYRHILEELVQHRERESRLEAERTSLTQGAELVLKQLQEAEFLLEDCQRRLAKQESEAGESESPDILGLNEQQRRVSRELDGVLRELARLEALALESAREQKLFDELERLNQCQAQLGGQELQLEEALVLVRVQLSEASRAREQVRAILDLAPLRASLVEGEPCPLCGATEHPWGADHSFTEKLLSPGEARIQELSTQQQALLEQKAGLSGAQQSLAAKIELLSGDLQDLRQQALERRKIPLQAKTKLEETRQQLQEHQEQLEEAIGLAKAEQAMFQENQKRLKELKAELGKEKDSVNRLKQLELEARLKKERALSSQEAVLLRIKEIISRLPDSLKARAEIEPARAFEWFQTSLTRFLSWREQARSAKDAITLKAPREAVLRNLVSSKEEQLSLLKEERTIAALQLKNLLTSRNQLFGNRRVEEFLQSQQQSLAAATHALSSLSQETARQEARMLLAIEQEQKAKDAYQHRIQQQEQASLALAIGLQGQDEAELRQALLKGPEWIRQTREALWEGQRGVEQWQVLVKERKASLEGWRSHAPLQSQEQAYSTVQLSELRRKQLQDVLLSTTQKLFQDGQLEHRKLELEPGLEGARRERSRWGILSELIGSADGKSFRTFAQGLTLELLLSYANENLAHLNPRYQLDRAPNPKKDARGDMNVQVIDLYMGGEIRPISSLSGGELFLASLALALGLASLAGQRTRVETVFIDEGFGSLDARTLDTALSALEVLQSEGRQVGIVSHVAALNERVGAQVLVQKVGADRSIVKVEAGR